MRGFLLLALFAEFNTSLFVRDIGDLVTDALDPVVISSPDRAAQTSDSDLGDTDLSTESAHAATPNDKITDTTRSENLLTLASPIDDGNSFVSNSPAQGISASKSPSSYRIVATDDIPNIWELVAEGWTAFISFLVYFQHKIPASFASFDGSDVENGRLYEPSVDYKTQKSSLCPVLIYGIRTEPLCDLGLDKIKFITSLNIAILDGFTQCMFYVFFKYSSDTQFQLLILTDNFVHVSNLDDWKTGCPINIPSLVSHWCCDPAGVHWRGTPETSVGSHLF